MRTIRIKKCLVCKKVSIPLWKKYCSRQCYGKVISERQYEYNNPNYKNGTMFHRGYKFILLPRQKRRKRKGLRKGKYFAEHRYIIEKLIGRQLKPSERVHHINGNRADNRVNNLKLVTISEHNRIHHHCYEGSPQQIALDRYWTDFHR